MTSPSILEQDPKRVRQSRYFYHGLSAPATPAKLESLLLEVIDRSPGNQYDSVTIQDEHGLALADARGFINACQRLTVEFCQKISSLPEPISLDGSRRHGTITALTELVVWCLTPSGSLVQLL